MTRLGLLAVAGLLCAALASAQPAIRLRNRSLPARGARLALTPGRHQIVQFESYPDQNMVEQLVRRGVRVLGYIPDNALMIEAPADDALNGLPVSFVGSLDAADKLAPGIADRPSNRFLAMFHADVGAGRIRELARASGFEVIENPALAPGHLVLSGPFDRIAELAARDELAYVMPASVDLVTGAPVLSCPGAVSSAGEIGEYAQAGQGWPKDSSGSIALKYVFQNFTTKVGENTVRGEIERAFREWAKYTDVTFSEGNSADAARTVAILFASGLHGDVYPFDGPGKSLAHTFYPTPLSPEPLAGDMHLDADEEWGAGAGIDVFSVALHEAGHVLGLAHSTDPAAVMYPYYRSATGLASDDIAAIQALYGTAVSSTAPPVPPVPPVPPEPDPPTTPQPPPVPPVPPVPSDPSAPAEPTPPAPPEPAPPTTPAPPSAPAPPTSPTPAPPETPTPPSPAPAPAKDTTSPSLRITTPGSTILYTSAASITVSGTASDDTGVTSVKWSTGTGDSGMATGTTSWSASIRLYSGTNILTIRAYDAAGNSGWRSLTVVRP